MTENEHYENNEIDLKEVIESILSRKKFIIGFTAIVAVLAILYSLLITPTYKASISFLSPSQSSIIELDKIKLDSDSKTTETTETSKNIYQQFLNIFMSREFQRKVFDKNNYLTKLNPKNKPIDNLDSFFYNFYKTLNVQSIQKMKNIEKINFEKPVQVTIEGNNPQVIADYLNDLAISANKETVEEFLKTIKQQIAIRLNQISKEIHLLEKHHNKKRNNRIKELSLHLSIAKELGIKDNNLGSESSMDDISLIVDPSNYDIQDIQRLQKLQLPKWYLFGEDALTKEIELLKSKKYSYIPEVSTLEVEAMKLESYIIKNNGINAMQLNQHAFPPNIPIKPNKRLIVLVAAVAGFVLSILWVLIMNAFRTKNNKVTE